MLKSRVAVGGIQGGTRKNPKSTVLDWALTSGLSSSSSLGQVAFYFMVGNDRSSTFTKALCVGLEKIFLVSFKPVVGKEWSEFKRKVYDFTTVSSASHH